MEAINNAGTCVGLLCSDGLVLASEKKSTSSLLQPSKTSEKTLPFASHLVGTVAGLTADAQLLTDEARWQAAEYQYTYGDNIPPLSLVEFVCNTKQYYTQRGGLRPFGVAFLIGGYHDGTFHLYQTDPSGNYSGWKATVIGANNQAGKSLLKNEYYVDNENETPPTVSQGLQLAVRVLQKTMDGATGPNAHEKMELFCMTLNDNNKVVHKILKASETQAVVTAVEAQAMSTGDA